MDSSLRPARLTFRAQSPKWFPVIVAFPERNTSSVMHGVDAGVPAGQVAVGSVFLDAAGIASVIATKGRRQCELVTSDRLIVAQ